MFWFHTDSSEVYQSFLDGVYNHNYIENINISKNSDEVENNIQVGYTTTRVNVRLNPCVSDNIIDVYERNTRIEYEKYNEEWVKIYIGQEFAFININYISEEMIVYNDYSLPSNSGFKSYMPYKAITSESSPQYRLQLDAYTNEETGIRMINGRYCVALGSYFNCGIGQEFDLLLENGVVIPCIMGDEKADKDTDSNNLFTKDNGCATEFIVDSKILPQQIKNYGDISYAYEGWDSPVSTIRVYE